MMRLLNLHDFTENMIYSSAFPEAQVLFDKAKLWALKWKPPLQNDTIKHNTMLCFRLPLPIALLHKSR